MTQQVVIIDDQATSRVILEELVSQVDPTLLIHVFASSMEAMDWIDSNQPDLILTDYRMPDLDGVELTRRVREMPRCSDVPIMVITVVDDQAVRFQALESGATDILYKPINHHECRARCRNLLTLRRQSQIIRNRARWLERQVGEATKLLHRREQDIIYRLAHAATYAEDPEGIRVKRVAAFSRLIASKLGMKELDVEIIEIGAMLHDVGKATIDQSLLLKPGPLDPAEFEVVKGHAQRGADLLSQDTSPYVAMGAQIALHSHERFDGKGYPRGLLGEQIPLAGRIVAIANSFDAMTSNRCYAPALSMERAVERINAEKGRAYDPRCTEAFISQLDRVAAIEAERHPLKNVD